MRRFSVLLKLLIIVTFNYKNFVFLLVGPSCPAFPAVRVQAILVWHGDDDDDGDDGDYDHNVYCIDNN